MSILKRYVVHILSAICVAITLPAVVSCQINDDQDFVGAPTIDPRKPIATFDDDGQPLWVNNVPCTTKEFQRLIEGRGWRCESSYEIDSKGFASNVNMWNTMVGMGPEHYYFDRDSITVYYYNDAFGYLNGGMGHTKYEYVYNEADNGVYVNGVRKLQIKLMNSKEAKYLAVIQCVGMFSNGKDINVVSIYRKLTDQELREMNQVYHRRW